MELKYNKQQQDIRIQLDQLFVDYYMKMKYQLIIIRILLENSII